MRNILIVSIFTLLPQILFSTQPGNIESYYQRLDQVIDSAEHFRSAKEVSISQLKSKIETTQELEQLQVLNSMLYTEYSKYDSDAAFELVISNIERCKENNDTENYALWTLRKAYIYSASGLLMESFDLLNKIRPIIASRRNLLEYYLQMKYLHSHMEQYALGDSRLATQYLQLKANYTDSISRVIRPIDNEYLLNKAWQHYHSDSMLYYRTQLEERLQNSRDETHEYAMDAYAVAHMYSSENNRDKFIEYLTISAIADVKSCNHDIASFQELAEILLEGEDINRAYNYLSYTLSKAMQYGDRVRVMAIASLMDATYGQLFAKNRMQSRNLKIFLALLIISLCAVVILFYNWVLKNRNLRSALSSLDKVNTSLDENIRELEVVNKELSTAYEDLRGLNEKLLESNYIKEKYIAGTFEVCSTHISKMETIFIKITNLVRKNKLDELKRYCDSSLLLNVEIKILYQAFDYTFLKMYPNFIEQFNAMLAEEKQIKPSADGSLNTELRILALNRLGISDNQKIASILHCSLQTVYNNYQKTKNRTELSSKQLHSIIMKIGS